MRIQGGILMAKDAQCRKAIVRELTNEKSFSLQNIK